MGEYRRFTHLRCCDSDNEYLMCCHLSKNSLNYVLYLNTFLIETEKTRILSHAPVPGSVPCSWEKRDLKTNPFLDAAAGRYCGSFEKYCRFVPLMLAVLQCCILNCWVRFHLPALSSVLNKRGEVSRSASERQCVCLWFSSENTWTNLRVWILCGPVCVLWFFCSCFVCVWGCAPCRVCIQVWVCGSQPRAIMWRQQV